MNKLLTKICDKYEISDDVQSIILNHLQRKLFNGGWKHLHRPENIKWTKKFISSSGGRDQSVGSPEWLPLYHLLLYVFRDNPTERLVTIYASSYWTQSTRNQIRELNTKIDSKLTLPFTHTSERYRLISASAGCILMNKTKEQLIKYINEYTTFKVKKSWTRDEIIRTILSGDRRIYNFESRTMPSMNHKIISPQESSRRYLKKMKNSQ